MFAFPSPAPTSVYVYTVPAGMSRPSCVGVPPSPVARYTRYATVPPIWASSGEALHVRITLAYEGPGESVAWLRTGPTGGVRSTFPMSVHCWYGPTGPQLVAASRPRT